MPTGPWRFHGLERITPFTYPPCMLSVSNLVMDCRLQKLSKGMVGSIFASCSRTGGVTALGIPIYAGNMAYLYNPAVRPPLGEPWLPHTHVNFLRGTVRGSLGEPLDP